MAIYRVTFQTEMLIDCETEGEAERIGYHYLQDEVRNGSNIYRIEKVETVNQLRRNEIGSLPWRDSYMVGMPETRVEEILEAK